MPWYSYPSGSGHQPIVSANLGHGGESGTGMDGERKQEVQQGDTWLVHHDIAKHMVITRW